MPLDTNIIGPSSKKRVEVVTNDDHNTLLVSTIPYKPYSNSIRFFLSDTYGADMNKNGAASGTPIEVHNGTDNAYWTATAISGTWTFDSTDQAYAGSKSIKSTITVNDDVAQIAKGSNQDLTGYISISGYIYLTKWRVAKNNHVSLYGWNTGTGAMVGTSVYIDDYIDVNVLGSWQKFDIPFFRMSLTNETIDSIRIRTEATGTAPDYYLDDIQIEESGESIVYRVIPNNGEWLHVYSINASIADAYTGFVDTSDATTRPTMPNIPYNGFLGVSTLNNGVTYRRIQNEVVTSSTTIKQTMDLMNFSHAELTGYGSDGTNSWISILIRLSEPLVLKPEDGDRLSMTVNDDLTGLLYFRVSCGCKSEQRE